MTVVMKAKLTFGEWLRLKRSQKKLSQQEVATKLGIKAQTVSSWENGKTAPALNPLQLDQLCTLLEIEPSMLIKVFREGIEIG